MTYHDICIILHTYNITYHIICLGRGFWIKDDTAKGGKPPQNPCGGLWPKSDFYACGLNEAGYAKQGSTSQDSPHAHNATHTPHSSVAADSHSIEGLHRSQNSLLRTPENP